MSMNDCSPMAVTIWYTKQKADLEKNAQIRYLNLPNFSANYLIIPKDTYYHLIPFWHESWGAPLELNITEQVEFATQ